MNNKISAIFITSLLATISSISHAGYMMHIPTEEAKGGLLPNGSISFLSAPEESPEPEEPTEIVWDVETVRKTKFYPQISVWYTDTYNKTKFTNLNGGFDHRLTGAGKSYITYNFRTKAGDPDGHEFGEFEEPSSLIAESNDVRLNCIKGDSYYAPTDYSSPYITVYANYDVRWDCDGTFPNLVGSRPNAMKLKFKN
jgi:hypothetical protein